VLGMGLAGIATRVLCLSRGTLLTFAALRAGAESASGQPTVKELAQRYRARELSATSEIYGVMGYPVGHSRSPLMHNAALQNAKRDGIYLPLEVDDAVSFVRDFVHPQTKKLDWNLRGLSVTIPHKLAVMPLLDALDATAQRVGAVNTIVVEGERLVGYNTDVAGAMQPLEAQIELRGARVAVLGAGGSARAVCYGLSERGAVTTVYARDVSKAQTLADEFNATGASLAEFTGECDIVINCTPIGMKGVGEGASPVPAESLRGVKLVYDLVYNPEMTQLLSDAQSAGCVTLGGLTMLTTQACEQFRLWTGEVVSMKLMWRAVMS
jgi:3-dehydroquinate dehydratase / shikimate dehydrogenase